MSEIKFTKKIVFTKDVEEQEIIELLAVKGDDFVRAEHNYIRKYFGIEGKDFKRVIFWFPINKIKKDSDELKPLCETVEIEFFDSTTVCVYFEIPKPKFIN